MTDIGIGNNCNNCCVMCTAVMPLAKGYIEPSTEQVLREIEKVADDSVTITGGEPTLRKDLFQIIKYINEKYPDKRINLITNGRMFYYPKFVEKFQGVRNLCVITELHAAEAKLHDEITQAKGSFRQSFEGIKNLLRNRFVVEFRIVVSRLNYKEVPEIAKMIVGEFNRVDRVVIFPIDIIGNAFVNKEKTVVKYSELVPFVEESIDILDKANVKVELYHIPYCVLSEKYHKFIKKGITVLERRVVLEEVCKRCRFEADCPRVWKTYAKQVGVEEFERVR